MSASDEEARGGAGILSPATKPRDRVRLDIHFCWTPTLRVQMPIPLQTREEGRLTILQRASTRISPGQTTPITTTLPQQREGFQAAVGLGRTASTGANRYETSSEAASALPSPTPLSTTKGAAVGVPPHEAAEPGWL